jgi:hypothetical protein
MCDGNRVDGKAVDGVTLDDAGTGPTKIFGIGLNKTGTSSLHVALRMLGLRSLHWGGAEGYRKVRRAHEEGRPLLHYFTEDYDAYMDIGWLTANFDLADAQYPRSKFILTTRDVDGWLNSRQRHVERNVRNQAAGRYDGKFVTVDRTDWWHEYRKHHRRVYSYFADRPDDLLVMDICAGDGYEKLCAFLGKPVVAEPFPRENRDRWTTAVQQA